MLGSKRAMWRILQQRSIATPALLTVSAVAFFITAYHHLCTLNVRKKEERKKGNMTLTTLYLTLS